MKYRVYKCVIESDYLPRELTKLKECLKDIRDRNYCYTGDYALDKQNNPEFREQFIKDVLRFIVKFLIYSKEFTPKMILDGWEEEYYYHTERWSDFIAEDTQEKE